MKAVKSDAEWRWRFRSAGRNSRTDRPDLDDASKYVWREWPYTEGYVANEEGLVACKIYKTLPARRVWDLIMSSTYDFAEPGFILVDKVNQMNNNWWTENIRATKPCGEPTAAALRLLPPGIGESHQVRRRSVHRDARFDWETYRKVVKVFTRMLDNVVEINGLPLAQQRDEILRKAPPRHGVPGAGFGHHHAVHEVRLEEIGWPSRRMCSREMAVAGWEGRARSGAGRKARRPS